MREILSGAILVLYSFMMYEFGWVRAHEVVLFECRKIETFYVGDHVIDCLVRKENGIR